MGIRNRLRLLKTKEKTIKKALGETIKRIRTEKGLTQGAVALKSGVDIKVISRVETGAVWPEHPTLESIAGALGIKEVDLLTTTTNEEHFQKLQSKIEELMGAVKSLVNDRKTHAPEQDELIGLINNVPSALIPQAIGLIEALTSNKTKTTRKALPRG